MTAITSMSRPLIISGPSGSGKSTLLTRLFKEFPNSFSFSVSHTTRKARPGEANGVNYHFVTRDTFLQLKSENGFIETAEFSGNLYGTSFKAVDDCRSSGKICVLDIEIQGVRSLKAHPTFNGHYLYISPPSIPELESRLRKRLTEDESSLQLRLESAKKDIEAAKKEQLFEVEIINEDVEVAYKKLVATLSQWYNGILPLNTN